LSGVRVNRQVHQPIPAKPHHPAATTTAPLRHGPAATTCAAAPSCRTGLGECLCHLSSPNGYDKLVFTTWKAFKPIEAELDRPKLYVDAIIAAADAIGAKADHKLIRQVFSSRNLE
jgi:hypothetical protein